MPEQVNVYDAKTQLSRLIDRVLAGERVTIARAGRPVVDLIPHTGAPIVFGGLHGQIDFDEAVFDDADAEIASSFDFADDIDVAAR